MKVVVLAPESGRADMPSDAAWSAHEVTVIGWAGAAHVDIELSRPGSAVTRIDRLLVRTPVGRVTRRLTPFDPGSLFWAAVRRRGAARHALDAAEIVVAAERDAVYAAWRVARLARRQRRSPRVVQGWLAGGVALKSASLHRRVVLLKPSGVLDESSISGLKEAADVCVVSWSGASAGGLEHVTIPRPRRAPLATHLSAWASRSPIGRTLLRLTPADEGAMFWRAARQSSDVRQAVRGAIVVAGERDAIFTAWRMLHDPRWRVRDALNGISAVKARMGS